MFFPRSSFNQLYRIMTLFYSSLKGILCSHLLWISPGLVTTPKIPSCSFSTPSPRKSIQSSKNLCLQHCKCILHPWGFTSVTPTTPIWFCCSLYFIFPTLWILSHWKMPKCAPGMTWGRGKKQPSLPCLYFQHCWSADPDCYLLNNDHFPPLTLSVNLTSLPRSLGYYQQLFPFIRHFCNSRGSPEVQACGFQMASSRPWAHSKQVLGWFLTAVSTLTKSITAMYSEQETSQSRIIWGAVVGKVSMDSWKAGDGHSWKLQYFSQ